MDGIESVSALSDLSRRGMFAFIRRSDHPVTRDEAAASMGISRKLAAFHLDKLVDAGLLRARYGTPGAPRRVGRQPKVYEPTDTQITVSIPDRRHELLADLLLEGMLNESGERTAAQAATDAAAARGRRLGELERERSRPGRLGAERGLTLCERMLDAYGYEPVRESPTQIRLRNCPFHPSPPKLPTWSAGSTTPSSPATSTDSRPPPSRRLSHPSPGPAASSSPATTTSPHRHRRSNTAPRADRSNPLTGERPRVSPPRAHRSCDAHVTPCHVSEERHAPCPCDPPHPPRSGAPQHRRRGPGPVPDRPSAAPPSRATPGRPCAQRPRARAHNGLCTNVP
ncbi:hypothetical protein ACFQZC_38520 [Streptacidiphilus monticola]